MVSALLAAAAILAPPTSTCAATPVNYQRSKSPGYSDAPWVLARPVGPGIIGSLPDYPQSMRDGRVNRSDRLVLWTTGAKIVWSVRGAVVARRLDGPGRFVAESELAFPAPGCWRLTVRGERGAASVVARVVAAPTTLSCPATLLQNGLVFPRPRSSGIRGGWPWQTTGPASLTTHGHAGDKNMKVLWQVRRSWGRSLELVGARLDGRGTFAQEFPMARSPAGFFPSIVDIPAAGCWLFTLRTAKLAGVLVVRAVDYGG